MEGMCRWLVLCLALSLAGGAQAQPGSVAVVGQVVDSFGDPVASADVVLESLSGYREAGVTDGGGRVAFPAVVVGSYRVVVERAGFEAWEREVVMESGEAEFSVVLMAVVPATLEVRATDPQGLVLPGVALGFAGPRGERLEGVTGPDGVFVTGAVRPGAWRVEGALPGFVATSSVVDAAYGAAGRVELAMGLDLARAENVVVLGSTRPVGRRVPVRLVDSPVTTTVIQGDALGVGAGGNLGEALRSVPGLNVVQLSARDVQLTSRQSTGILANSQLVLMDGRSVYLDFFGMVLWDALPAAEGDIEQVEVVRGPASVTWGPNAMTGAVHFITKSPRENVGTTVTMGAGWVDREAGSTVGDGPGLVSGSSVSVRRAPSETLAYRVSAGYFRSAALPRPVGRVPVISDPRERGEVVGGAWYPLDGAGPLGDSFVNRGTAQPKFDVRVDQELGDAQLSYSGGVSGTDGVTHTGLGPFDLRRGVFGYGKLGYTRGDLRVQFFTNLVAGDAPSLLLADPGRGGGPVSFGFVNRTVDFDVGHSRLVGGRHLLGYGANVRHNRFDLSAAPDARDRVEFGGYVQDEMFAGPFRLVLGGRLDKFGSVARPFFSPRVAVVYKLGDDHSLTASYNRALRSPSVIENFLNLRMVQPVDLSGLALFRPLLPGFVPGGLDEESAAVALAGLEAALDEMTARPFPLEVGVLGSDVAVPGRVRGGLGAESLTAYELRYSGAFASGTGLGAAVYVSRGDGSILGVPVDPGFDPYTAAEPPAGWLLPPEVLTVLGGFGVQFPRTGLTFVNRGGTRNLGLELWANQALGGSVVARASYSWQAAPLVLPAEEPYPLDQLSLPPAHRFSAGVALDGPRFLGSVSLNSATRAFWADVLTREYHGYTGGYALVDGSFGVKWRGGTVVTSVSATNVLNRSVQQHVFGDILRRTVLAELKLQM